MLYFMIYAAISAITLVLDCSDFDCRFTCDEPSNRRKNEAKGLEDQEELQRKPNRPNSGDPKQNLRTKKCTKNAAFKKRQDRTDQRPPRAACAGHHGPWCLTHDRSSWVARQCVPP